MARRFTMLSALARWVDQDGRLTPEAHRTLQALETRTAYVAPLAASPTNAQIATSFNALLTALQNAGLQEES